LKTRDSLRGDLPANPCGGIIARRIHFAESDTLKRNMLQGVSILIVYAGEKTWRRASRLGTRLAWRRAGYAAEKFSGFSGTDTQVFRNAADSIHK
jgi:hypothetical protein